MSHSKIFGYFVNNAMCKGGFRYSQNAKCLLAQNFSFRFRTLCAKCNWLLSFWLQNASKYNCILS